MIAWRSLLVERFARVHRDRSSRAAIHGLSEHQIFGVEQVWNDFLVFQRALATARLPSRSAVVLLVGNRAAFVPAFLATLEQRAILIPMDGGSTVAEAARLIDHFAAHAAIAPGTTRFTGVARITPLPHDLGLFRFHRSPAAIHDGDGSVFKLTSGSAGAPKAVSCSEANLVADGSHIIEAMGIGSEDVNLATIPLSHSYGIGNLVMPLILQGTPLVLRQSFVPDRFFDDVARQRVTVFPGVPFMFDYLRQHLADRAMPRSMRRVLTAGASISGETVAEFRRIFGLKIHSFYGTSETGGIAYDDSDTIQHPLSVGRPLPGTTVTLRAVDGRCGRVHVQGEAVAAGYAHASGEDHATFCDGGFLTDDLGYFVGDELVLSGRLPRFVNVAGRKVQPDEVERVLLEMPQIARARVLGLPCDTRGEKLVAFIVPWSGSRPSAANIRQYCSSRLSSHKIPRQFAFVDALPVDSRGKVDVRVLETLIAPDQGAQG